LVEPLGEKKGAIRKRDRQAERSGEKKKDSFYLPALMTRTPFSRSTAGLYERRKVVLEFFPIPQRELHDVAGSNPASPISRCSGETVLSEEVPEGCGDNWVGRVATESLLGRSYVGLLGVVTKVLRSSFFFFLGKSCGWESLRTDFRKQKKPTP